MFTAIYPWSEKLTLSDAYGNYVRKELYILNHNWMYIPYSVKTAHILHKNNPPEGLLNPALTNAAYLERTFSPSECLNYYLLNVHLELMDSLGNIGGEVKGVEEASRELFGKPLKDNSEEEMIEILTLIALNRYKTRVFAKSIDDRAKFFAARKQILRRTLQKNKEAKEE